MEDNVPAEVKQARADRVMAAQEEIALAHNQTMLGKQYRVLFDRVEGNYFVGRTEMDSPEVDNEVLIEKNKNIYCRIGDYVDVKILKADHFDLYAELIN